MERKSEHKVKPLNDVTLAKAFTTMFKEMKSGSTVYLAFSKMGFHFLIFTLAIGTAANIAMIDILLQGTGFINRANHIIVTFQIILSGISIMTGVWLFFKGVNIVADKSTTAP